ncbi:hypothetical protein PanWU01x14_204600 [Parasponia andersonii]|uniref:Uncharacterized protein n=1 Tax=Parasponia andersonii TaxID=3476 RepID=A0A2P5BWB0_PARAD|nr:hypothetical protein PanWU01x14_204600 [Parasponia andersonii]
MPHTTALHRADNLYCSAVGRFPEPEEPTKCPAAATKLDFLSHSSLHSSEVEETALAASPDGQAAETLIQDVVDLKCEVGASMAESYALAEWVLGAATLGCHRHHHSRAEPQPH